MNHYTHPETLAAYWQQSIDMGAEAGQRPLIGMGTGSLQPETVLPLLATAWMARRATHLRDPLLLVGGDGDLWWLAALQWSQKRTAAQTTLLWYAGADLATYAASANIARLSSSVDLSMRPPGMAWMTTPTALPGSQSANLAFLPCFLADDLFVPAPVPTAQPSWPDSIEFWLTLLLVIALLLATWLQ